MIKCTIAFLLQSTPTLVINETDSKNYFWGQKQCIPQI